MDSLITTSPDKTTVATGEFVTVFKGQNHHAAVQISILQQRIWELLHPQEAQQSPLETTVDL